MPADPFYRSPEWQALRRAALKRDGHRCTTPGCTSTKRLTVDHIVSRRAGGANALPNLMTRCIDCDNQVKESANGERRRGGRATARGCDAEGWPLAPATVPTPRGG
ncbi:HNH endonuclease [Paracraurococcus lichenis]|uniref:HNH endonuclease n=1 Tax=Paracraurococcus lichenis TaxID=3064888 RepID=A0ABT9E8E2_9PROT|nr:HNH endonuclease [Paracraurococcus sp. LOR1-02]MDO9712443.1 HNH endonuclease [Paracraurococcus sp. LOR1-02]